MTRVFNRERTWLDPVLRPIERLIYRVTGVDEAHEMRWTEYAVAMLLFSVVSMLRAVSDAARAAVAAVESAGLRGRSAGSRVQHRRLVHDEHELAGLQRRDDDELSHADGRPRVPQLRVGGDRHRAGDRVHPRHRAEGEGHARQLLGRPGPLLAVGAAAVLPRRRARRSCRRASCRTCGRTTRSRSSIRRP